MLAQLLLGRLAGVPLAGTLPTPSRVLGDQPGRDVVRVVLAVVGGVLGDLLPGWDVAEDMLDDADRERRAVAQRLRRVEVVLTAESADRLDRVGVGHLAQLGVGSRPDMAAT
ncbi:hypothetical protein P9209_20850 [Prescottella defluvii]|nr:hypothetical protein P9209_20850 [Prescottella defluvii]